MIRISLQCLRLIAGIATLLIISCAILYIDSLPDMFGEVKAQGAYETTYENFLQVEYRALAIQGVVTIGILAGLIFLFVKITRSLRKLK